MRPQHFCHLFHRLDPGAHRSGAPEVEKLSGPGRALVLPELLKILLEQIGPDRFEVAGQEFLEFDALFFGEVLWPFENAPAASG